MIGNLRKQLEELVSRNFSPEFQKAISFPRAVEALALKAFEEEWMESKSTRILRAGLQRLKFPGYITDEEPGIE